jgi:1,2-dihydroxy-3-keto-5-methylthiopentene dioxygenase
MKAVWLDSGKAITAEELNAQGITYMVLPTDPAAYQAPLEKVMKANGYVTQDEVNRSPALPNYDAMVAKFQIEHYHPGDEVRFTLAGGGIWEIRSLDDKWMKVEVGTGDFISVPDGRYHRFYLTDEKYIKCVRLFKDTNGWVQVYRHEVEAGTAKARPFFETK